MLGDAGSIPGVGSRGGTQTGRGRIVRICCLAIWFWPTYTHPYTTWPLRWHCKSRAAVRTRTCYPPSFPRFESALTTRLSAEMTMG